MSSVTLLTCTFTCMPSRKGSAMNFELELERSGCGACAGVNWARHRNKDTRPRTGELSYYRLWHSRLAEGHYKATKARSRRDSARVQY